MAEHDKGKSSQDVAPYNQAIHTAAKGVLDGAAAFLGRICLPVAEELGLLLRDQVSAWRQANAVRILINAESKLKQIPDHEGLTVHPRLALKALESGSWADDDLLQDKWASLLASSCSADGSDDSNLMFMNILDQLTSDAVRILDFAFNAGATPYTPVFKTVAELANICGGKKDSIIISTIEHLKSFGLVDGNTYCVTVRGMEGLRVNLMTTSLSQHLLLKCALPGQSISAADLGTPSEEPYEKGEFGP